MSFTQEPFDHAHIIRRVDDHGLLINETLYPHSVILTATDACMAWPVENVAAITVENLAPLLNNEPDIVLIGTGTGTHFLTPQLLQIFWEKRIGVEVMTTPSAAKTYNLLASEGRKVAAGLIVKVLR